MMTDKQIETIENLYLQSEKLELALYQSLKKEQAYLNSIACPSKEVMVRSTKIKFLLEGLL